MSAALSDREWRQMRRTMSKLEFDPVPETPSLPLRSLYADSPSKSRLQREGAAGAVENGEAPAAARDPSASALNRVLPKGILKVGAATATPSPDELPSSSASLALRGEPFVDGASAARVPSRRALEPTAGPPLPIADLDEHMAAAHEAVRQSVMAAVADLQTSLAKERAMERLQLTAAHSTDVTMLQSKIDELKEQLAARDDKCAAQESLMDRLLAFTAKHREQERVYWKGDTSIAACIRAWRLSVANVKSTRRAEQLADRHCTRRLSLSVLRGWARAAQQDAVAAKVAQLQTQHERRVVQVAQEYQLKVEQLQREQEEAMREVAALKKCRLQLEEDLRQVFLRGVSSMNIEALHVFSSRRPAQDEGPSDMEAAPFVAPSSSVEGSETDGRALGRPDAPPGELEHELPEPMVPPVPRPSDTLHSLDSNLQRLLHLSSKLSNSSAASARTEPSDSADRQPPPARRVNGANEPPRQAWARPRSFSSSSPAAAAASTSYTKLRSAEMVQQQQMAAFASHGPPVAPTPTPSAVFAYPPQMTATTTTTTQAALGLGLGLGGSRYQGQSAAKLQVEMELLRAEFAAAASKAAAKPRPSVPMYSRWK